MKNSGLTFEQVRTDSQRSRLATTAWPAILLVSLAAACWAVTVDRMQGMDMGPGTDLGGLGWFTGVWVTMMAAMMFPSLVPMALAATRASGREAAADGARSTGVVLLFSAGYLLPWITAGVAAYAVIEGVRSQDPGFLAWIQAGPYVAGAVLAAAALYELTPLKAACLRHCRDPGLLVERWHPGRLAALRAGVEQGGYCVGCCWALMAALFALGVMSLLWMVVIAALIAAEKLLPRSSIACASAIGVLAVLAVSIAFAADRLSGLTVPGSPASMQSMNANGMDGR